MGRSNMANILKFILAGVVFAAGCSSVAAQTYQPCWPGGKINQGYCVYAKGDYPKHPVGHLAPSKQPAKAASRDDLSRQADELMAQADRMLGKSAEGDTTYGAFAIDFQRQMYITSIGEPSKAMAEKVAKDHCGPDCKVLSYGNACFSMAQGSNAKGPWVGMAFDPGPTVAEKKAIADCKSHDADKCTVLFTECSYRTRILRYRDPGSPTPNNAAAK